MKNKTLKIYGHTVEVVFAPRAMNPRYFRKAVIGGRNCKRLGGYTTTLRTQHTLDVYCGYMALERNRCPYQWRVEVADDECGKCPYNLRKEYCSILPPYTIECGRYDARMQVVKGGMHDHHRLTIVADMTTVKAMAEYAKNVPFNSTDPKDKEDNEIQ